MLPHIPILRHGQPYASVERQEILHHATARPVACLSFANSGLIARDLARMERNCLERFTVAQLIDMSRRAADLFVTASLPLGETRQSFDDYLASLSATTGLPVCLCRSNAEKIRRVLAEIDIVLAGLTRGIDPGILDRGYGMQDGRMLSFFREAGVFAAVLPSNSPGVHTLWIPAFALKTPLALKAGREEPWTPYRVIQALIAAGAPPQAFGFYPCGHDGAAVLLRAADRSMLFGDASTTRPWQGDRRVQLHGPGYSKVILGEDAADEWPQYVDVMVSSILANGGRSCLNASAVWTPRNGRAIAEALANRLAAVRPLPADDNAAQLAAFADPRVAERISASIDAGLKEPGAVDLTEALRGTPRLARVGRCAYLLPTVVWCGRVEADADTDQTGLHPLANREFLFPYASVVECPIERIPGRIGATLIVTAITRDRELVARLMASANVDRLNIGAIPTWQIGWDQPHEGNLFEHLYRQRAFQIGPAAA